MEEKNRSKIEKSEMTEVKSRGQLVPNKQGFILGTPGEGRAIRGKELEEFERARQEGIEIIIVDPAREYEETIASVPPEKQSNEEFPRTALLGIPGRGMSFYTKMKMMQKHIKAQNRRSVCADTTGIKNILRKSKRKG